MKSRTSKVIIFLFFIAVFSSTSFLVGAFEVGSKADFFLESRFDAARREKVSAYLVKSSNNLYFYIDELWWNYRKDTEKEKALSFLDDLSNEFNNRIYPRLTSVFGSERRPGIDKDEKITVLFHLMNAFEGGYFREIDGYEKIQLPESNEREMVYLSADLIGDTQARAILAHEFTHLITFNQKNLILRIEEDIWLNEARAEYSSSILGYDQAYEGSVLQQRVKDFSQNQAVSLIEWAGSRYDYAAVNLFIQYLVDHYGINILSDSLKSNFSGIESINYALKRAGAKEDFGQIFTNWTIASFLNNCSLGEKYCYLNQNLKSFKLAPALNFLPLSGNVSMSVTNMSKNWQGNWIKFIGGSGNLKLEFLGSAWTNFKLPYITEDAFGNQSVKFFDFQKPSREISIKNFADEYKAFVIIPSLQLPPSLGDPTSVIFTYNISLTGEDVPAEQALIQQLLAQIAQLQAEIAKLRGGNSGSGLSCQVFSSDLFFGMSGGSVGCLQEFLKKQGPVIYPEGFVTGNFASLTRQAVIRFQEKYAPEILAPVGLSAGTGYVGPQTRAKINKLINS